MGENDLFLFFLSYALITLRGRKGRITGYVG